ncbi:hypothetical protein VTO73DRAFT_7191 [Trametes versicolor]
MPPRRNNSNAHSRLNSPAPARQAENGGASVPPGSNPPTPPITPERPTTPMPNNSRTGTSALRVNTNTSSTAGAGPSTAQAGTTTATAGPPMSAVGDPTSRRIDELLHTMQQTLSSLAWTFDVLGEQTLSVATLGPAVDARVKIDKVRQDVHDQHVEQDSAMQRTMTNPDSDSDSNSNA